MSQLILSLISGIFICGVAGYLGSLMISKRMGLVGGPLGHLALPGVALALVYHFNPFFGALLTIILGGVLVGLLEIKTKAPMEALTGLVFATGVALGFLILPFSEEHQLEEALIGDITKISFIDTALAIILCGFIFLIIKGIYSKLVLAEISEDLAKTEGIKIKKYNFIYLACIAIIVALTVKLVGGLLPVALIVIPALTARNFSKSSFQYSFGALCTGAISAILGIFLSQLYHLPAGLLIILAGALIFVASIFFRRL
jgi:ABC-type Mn2+/Zn2+ transport system permease subunit